MIKCSIYKTAILHGDFGNDMIRVLTENYEKKLLLITNSKNETQFFESQNSDLLIIFINVLDNINYAEQLTPVSLASGITVFVIIENNNIFYGSIKNIFSFFWKTSETSKVFVCFQSKNQDNVLELFTYNPYHDYAPSLYWSKYNDYNSTWAIYNGRYSKKFGKNFGKCKLTIKLSIKVFKLLLLGFVNVPDFKSLFSKRKK